VFALLLGYSRIPYAAAVEGGFFAPFARLDLSGAFPDVSLYVVGAIAIGASLFRLDQVVPALITTRVIVQFMAQVVAIPLLRRRLPESARPYRMWLYPLPAVVAFLGWTYIFSTSGWGNIGVGLVTLLAGVAAFLLWARLTRTWPFLAPRTVTR
jgi:amino acid transporter